MPTSMKQPPLELVPAGTPGAQRVAVLEAPGRLAVAHARVPEAGPHEVRVAITFVGICGSDLEAYRGSRDAEAFATPARLGHEVAGVLDQVGSSVVGLAVGDRVTCRYVWGALAEKIVCLPFNVKRMPPSFPMREISLVEVLPGILHAAELARITAHTSVLVMGQGVSGLVLTQVLRLFSPRVLAVTDLKAENLALAKRYGATHTYVVPTETTPTMSVVGRDFPDGFEVVIPCLLDGDGMMDALRCCAIAGRIIMYGCIGTCHSFDFFMAHRRRVEMYSTEPRRDIDMRRFFDEGVKLVTDGLVNTAEMITHVYPLTKVAEAFALRNDKSPTNKAVHVLIDCATTSEEVFHTPLEATLGAAAIAAVGAGAGGGAVAGAGAAADEGCGHMHSPAPIIPAAVAAAAAAGAAAGKA